MRILVVSDSHGDVFGLRLAIQAQPNARMMIHLGDGEHDMDAVSHLLKGMKVLQVRGNTDFGAFSPKACVETVEGKRFYCTHGDRENVKGGTDELEKVARDKEADIVLFGHTHVPKNEYDDGLYLFNPGSVREGSYGVVDITKAGIVCLHMKLFDS